MDTKGWIEVEMDKSYAQRVNFKDYAVRMMKTLEYGMAFCGKECMMVKV